jgi:adenine-specific DNA-methyltransferase
MPSLDFKGKQFVYTHHLTVLFRELVVDAKKSLPAKGKPSMDDNLIIHGDNLHALKALLPRYAGKVKCIYIDPPYNTGNEGWCYNDNVRSPLMQEWVKHGNPVEREDMERHDKWLSMMWPRLNLLRELLSDDGTIFMSIDDNERHHLHDIMDEIFGADNFVANIVWEKKYAVQSDSKSFSTNHDHIVAYAKNGKIWQPNHLVKNDKQLKNYKNSNNDPNGLWQSAVYT